MKITVTVDSFEELFNLSEELQKMNLQREIGIASIEGKEEKPEKKKAPKKEEPKTEEPEEVKEEAPAKEEAPKVDAVEVRKLLTKVNKAAGKNMAKEWIAELGHEALTDVTEADELAQLKAKAEEYLNA